ncbi:MAG: metallophosphoesterase [Rhodobiaceae bacterium]|nr:metallophosphoesterase [Rhodobiaceae bacterium]MCC0056393.1 metallophosphoesterase [Rhodobiaceae bacterium]
MFRLAHITDPHLPLAGRPRLRELVSKRFIGYSNWLRSRNEIHRFDILTTLVSDIHAAAPDHIACTGDLVNVASRNEFVPARRFLESLGPRECVSLVPGNHDAYAGSWNESMWREWGPYMTGDETVARDHLPDAGFPWVRRQGKIILIGLSSAITTMPFQAAGKVGHRQLRRLASLLDEAGRDGAFRVVLIHHSPLPGKQYRSLRDATELCEVLARHGAELVLHGHDHLASFNAVSREGAMIPVVGSPSASAMPHGRKPGAGWTLFSIAPDENGWRCHMQRRNVVAPGTPLEVMEEREL